MALGMIELLIVGVCVLVFIAVLIGGVAIVVSSFSNRNK